jgi:hypothetical protein
MTFLLGGDRINTRFSKAERDDVASYLYIQSYQQLLPAHIPPGIDASLFHRNSDFECKAT